MSAYVEKWQHVADDLLSILMVNPDAWLQAIDGGINDDDLPDGLWRKVYRAIIDLRAAETKNPKRLFSDTEIATKAGEGVTVEFVAERIALWDAFRESAFPQTLNLLRTFGRGHRQYLTLFRGAALLKKQLENGLNTDVVTTRVMDGLQVEQVTARSEPTDISALVEENEQRLNAAPVDGLMTGVWLIDDMLRGIAAGELVGWVAPYKSRKTSVMANVIINTARHQKQVDVYSFDESRERFYNRMQACLMAEYMWQNGLWEAHDDNHNPLNVVDAKMIMRAGNRWLKWDKRLQAARLYARDQLLSMKGYLRLYDRRVCNGTLMSIRGLSRLNAAKNGQLDLVVVDHIQRLGDWSKTYEQVEFGSAGLHDLAGELNAVVWALSQQNEEAIKAGNNGNWSPQTKGGGGLASNADTVFVSSYRQGTVTDADKLRIELKLAREAPTQFGYVEIHPSSGWITPRRIDTKTITTEAVTAALDLYNAVD